MKTPTARPPPPWKTPVVKTVLTEAERAALRALIARFAHSPTTRGPAGTPIEYGEE